MSAAAFTSNKICRCCLRSCENPHNIFDLTKNITSTQLAQCILETSGVQVSQDDNLPESICMPCYDNLKISYSFRLQVQKNHSFLISILKEDLIEELPDTDNNENIEIEANTIQYPIEEYQISDIKYTFSNEEILINIENNDNNSSNTKHINENSENNYINEFVNYIDDFNKDTIVDENKNLECKICNKKFKYTKNLLFHERKHLNEGSIQCQYCTKNFYKNYDLKRHIQVQHIKIKEYICTICKAKFYTKPELNRHIKYHSNLKNFKCFQCEQNFFDKTTLDVHIRVVHLKEKNYNCDFCNKKFSTLTKVRRHQNTEICNSTAAKIISTINVGQHLVILDYDPNSVINNDEINKPQEILPENLLTEENINSNLSNEGKINYNLLPDLVQQITDPVQKFLN